MSCHVTTSGTLSRHFLDMVKARGLKLKVVALLGKQYGCGRKWARKQAPRLRSAPVTYWWALISISIPLRWAALWSARQQRSCLSLSILVSGDGEFRRGWGRLRLSINIGISTNSYKWDSMFTHWCFLVFAFTFVLYCALHIGRSPRRDLPDHAFMLHCTFSLTSWPSSGSVAHHRRGARVGGI